MKIKTIFLCVSAVILVFAVSSCDDLLSSLFGVSIEERIAAFETTLNTAERTDILDHIHPDMKNRKQLNEPLVIDDSPIAYANHDFEIGAPTIDDQNVATCSYLDGNGAEGEIVFEMALDGYDYKIKRLTLTLDNVPPENAFLEFKRLFSK